VRIRNIKPGFFKNEVLADMTPMQNLLFIGLWLIADKNGCIEWRPRRIMGELFALRDYSAEELQKDCGSLAEGLLISFYRVSEGLLQTEECTMEEAEYLHITKFAKHQQLTSWEKKESKVECVPPAHFSSTTEVLQPEVAEVLKYTEEAEETEVAEEGKGSAATSELLRQFQQSHPSCEKVGQVAFDAAVLACTTKTVRPDVSEAIEAFSRQMAGATLRFPLREFEKYLRHSCKKATEEVIQKKKNALRVPSMIAGMK